MDSLDEYCDDDDVHDGILSFLCLFPVPVAPLRHSSLCPYQLCGGPSIPFGGFLLALLLLLWSFVITLLLMTFSMKTAATTTTTTTT